MIFKFNGDKKLKQAMIDKKYLYFIVTTNITNSLINMLIKALTNALTNIVINQPII